MVVDATIINSPFTDTFDSSIVIRLNEQNYKEYGLVSYDYVATNERISSYTFLDMNIHKMAFKVDEKDKIKEVLLVLKVWDSEHFFRKMVETYELPNTSSLSKFYIEKHGFDIPTSINKDSLENYYNKLPKPEVNEFHELKSLIWYDVIDKTKENQADIIIKNRTNPSNKFSDKEIWVIIKRAK